MTLSPILIDLSKELSKDRKALNELSMNQTSASCKMKYGLAETITHHTLENLRQTPFSLNIDESTSSNHKRVLAILVSYFCKTRQEVVIEHLAAIEVIKVDAKSLYDHLVKLFTDNNIPWKNLVSVLMDSCSVMRGSKAGVEQKIKAKAPKLADIDGDVCHHIHNACKVFCKPFDGWVETAFRDVHNDFKWSADLKDYLSEMCELMNIKFTMPQCYVSHRWLSVYDVSLSTLRIWDALVVFYYAFLSKDDRGIYLHTVLAVYRKQGISKESRARIREIRNVLTGKKMTDDGKKRKTRIISRLFHESKRTLLTMNFYVSVLPLMKNYVCVFQTSEPMVHKLHDKQEEVFRQFLSCYIKQELIAGKSAKQLKKMNISTDEDQYLGLKDMFTGNGVKDILKETRKDDQVRIKFMKQAAAAYVTCGKYIQGKLPLNNPLLRALSAIDPEAPGHTQNCRELKALPQFISSQLPDQSAELEVYQLEVQAYQVDSNLPDRTLRIDKYWAAIFDKGKYELLSKVVVAALSIFHGPLVESSFNIMGDIMVSKSPNIQVKTYSSIQSVKYWLRSHQKNGIQMFSRSDVLHDPVDKRLSYNMRKSAAVYKRKLKEKQEDLERKRQRLQLKEVPMTKTKSVALLQQASRRARLAHMVAQKKKIRTLGK